MNNIEIAKKYQPLFNPPEGVDTFIITGGRFSQKSFAVSLASVYWASNYEHRILYSRFTNVSAKDSIIPEFEEKIEILNYQDYFIVNESRIESLFNNSKIVFKGLKSGAKNQTANLKSLKDFSVWVLEEAEELTDFDVAQKTMLSIRGNGPDSPYRNLKVFILNPTTKEHWIYKEYFEDRGVKEGANTIKDNVCYIHSSYLDIKKYVPQDILIAFEDLKKRNINRYNHVVMGGWLEKAEGVIYRNWSYGKFNEELTLKGYGLDFGFSIDPTALVEIAIDKGRKKLYIRLIVYELGLSTDEIAFVCEQCNEDLIIADSAEPRLIHELKNTHRLNIKPCRKGQGSVTAGISILQDYEIIVDPHSTEIGKELNHYTWHDKRSKTPNDAYNHALDAMRYIAVDLLQGNKVRWSTV